MGNFSVSDNNVIQLSASGCTKMCCDSEFSKKFVQMLPQVESYQIEKNKLKLDVPGWGWINLKLYD
jgi:heat shock protein HslJ